jgi:hypothetical protein
MGERVHDVISGLSAIFWHGTAERNDLQKYR